MLKYICNSCGNTRELSKATLKVIDGKVRTEQAQCECGDWMQEVEKEFNGFPNLIRTEPTLRKKEVTFDEYYGTDMGKGYREKEQQEINKELGIKNKYNEK